MLFIFFTMCALMALAGAMRYTIEKNRIKAVIKELEFKLIRYAISAIGSICVAVVYYDCVVGLPKDASPEAVVFSAFGVAFATALCTGFFILPAIGKFTSHVKLKYLKKKLRRRGPKHKRKH